MTAPAEPEQRYIFRCICCKNVCTVSMTNAIPPDCGCLINSDIGAIWTSHPSENPRPPKMASEKDLLNQIRDLHAAAHTEMCKDDADEIHVSFYKGQWLAYNNVAGLVEHMVEDTPAQQRIADAIKLIGEAKAANNNHHWLTVNKLLEQTIALLREVK